MEQIDINVNSLEFIRSYNLDYLGKYYFYEEDEFVKKKEAGEYILEQLKLSNRFDYNGSSYTFSRFGNLVENITDKNVKVTIQENNINILIHEDLVHLDLIYKFETKKLEDHVRIATKISEKNNSTSCFMYIDYSQEKDFLKALNYVKKLQEQLASPLR